MRTDNYNQEITAIVLLIIAMIYIFFVLPISSVKGGLENICYNYPPSHEYYFSYPQKLHKATIDGTLLKKGKALDFFVTSLYPSYGAESIDSYTFVISFNYLGTDYTISESVTENVYNKYNQGDNFKLDITTTNCFNSGKKIIKYSSKLLYVTVKYT